MESERFFFVAQVVVLEKIVGKESTETQDDPFYNQLYQVFFLVVATRFLVNMWDI